MVAEVEKKEKRDFYIESNKMRLPKSIFLYFLRTKTNEIILSKKE